MDKRGPKLGDAASLYVQDSFWMPCNHACAGSAAGTAQQQQPLLTTVPVLYPCAAQMELYTIAWMDERGIADTQAMLDEVWNRAVGSDPGNWLAAWQADTAAEWCNTATVWATVSSRCVVALVTKSAALRHATSQDGHA